MVEFEQNMEYGVKAEVFEVYEKLSTAVEANSPAAEFKRIVDSCTVYVYNLYKHIGILYAC